MVRPLGKTQEGVLDALNRHQRYPGGWLWDTPSNTVAILESLVKRGLVDKMEHGRQAVYEPAGNRPYDGALCEACGERPAIWDYDPFVAEIHEDADPSALLCGECWGIRKGDV